MSSASMEDQVRETVRGLFADAASIEIKDMDVGVLSRVFHVTVTFASGASPRELVAKCPRPEFPFLHSMFDVEGAFYTQTRHDGIPFRLPTFLYASSEIVVLDKVPNVVSYKCVDGCPQDRIVPILSALGRMHGQHWNQTFPQLAKVPGIGASLPREAKQTQFPLLFAPFLAELAEHAAADVDMAAMHDLCVRLSADDGVGRVHDAVGGWHTSLLHGDFHVANLLFDAVSDAMWLLDWATSGTSNPLRDVAFFFIVGVTSADRRATETKALRAYYDHLAVDDDISFDAILRMYWLCVVNQFVILVVYNELTMSLAKQGGSVDKQASLRHGFLETNHRACLAFLDACAHLDLDTLLDDVAR
ncbi:Aste57867_10199 [Aphanomyces stellatus]|uniref:Aste57867_10199 protein n=1 Tax=Aphanomyces stellatus TaxID=120398 RepID=A0A485KQ85_9STRA|nr:hypothetical protein As57867_010160 [Aphanomyces stellatus]VFT87075.1 Aste57867_10199 [Aphanomyces stellatus]